MNILTKTSVIAFAVSAVKLDQKYLSLVDGEIDDSTGRLDNVMKSNIGIPISLMVSPVLGSGMEGELGLGGPSPLGSGMEGELGLGGPAPLGSGMEGELGLGGPPAAKAAAAPKAGVDG